MDRLLKPSKHSRHRSNSKGRTKRVLDWNEYASLVDDLAEKVRCSNDRFDCIYGVPRGGMIPAVMISHVLDIPIMGSPLDGYKKRMLVVDDLVDTGKTIVDLMKLLNGHVPSPVCKLATLFRHKACSLVPDFYVEENDEWIIFPYEMEQ